jgi:formate hydrogenlyase subunit 6/NADH:ubiquinone oxidoreductase subunit I
LAKKGRRHSAIYLLPELLRTLLSPRITVRYPFEPMELPSAFRGRVTVDPELCRGCGLCVRDCPANALELDHPDNDHHRLSYYVYRCAFCGQCQLTCPFGAITLTNELAPPSDDRDPLCEVFAKENEE